MINEWNLIKCISKKRRVGKVWLVSNEKDPSLVGYLKQPTSTSTGFSGPLLANEYLAYLLGKELSLPIAEIVLVEINGVSGVISLKKIHNKKLYNWNKVKNHPKPCDHILQAEGLLKMFVFDVWIANIDRNHRNIILYESNKKDIYEYYLIDHGLCLLGSFKWKQKNFNSDYWNHVYKYNRRYLKGLPKFILHHQEVLYDYVKEVQALTDSRIEEIIQELPSKLLSSHKKKILKSFLTKRKANLPIIIENWLMDYQQHLSNPTISSDL